MAYDTLKKQLGREHIEIVEIDMDFCNLSYGVAPCTASIPTTGSRKCYNTFNTCQDKANFDKGSKLYRFSSNTSHIPVGVNLYPCVKKISYSPTRIKNNGLSERAVIKISMTDFPHHDRGVDPYVSDRTFNPATQGTFWGKWLARNPFYINRTIRIKEGFIDHDNFDTSFSTDFKTRTYLIQDISLDDKGNVTITAKDILKLADEKRSKAPVQSVGKLSADIDAVVTSIALDDVTGYPAAGTVRIGDELITYTSIVTLTLTGCTRGTSNTIADTHSTDDEVQTCLVYTSVTVQDIIEDLLVNYAGVSSAFIPKTEWDADPFLTGYNLTTIITEPTGVNKLLAEITEQTSSNLWWEDTTQNVRLKSVAPPLPTDEKRVFNDMNILQNSIRVTDMEKDRISRVTVRYSITDYTKDLKEPTNFKNTLVTVDADAEGVNEYDGKKERVIYSRWLQSQSLASEISQRILSRFRDTPKQIEFSADAKDNDALTGETAFVTTRLIVDDTGENLASQFVLMEDKTEKNGSVVSFVGSLYNTGITGGIYGLIAPDATLDFTAESDANKEKYLFISTDAALMSDGSPAYRIA